MSVKPSRPIRAVHCFQTQLENAGNAGSTVLDLLELQSSDHYRQPQQDPDSPKVWDASKKVLDIKLTNQSGFPLDAFEEIKDLASNGLPPLDGVLYAVLTVTDSLSPTDAPLRIACTVRLGRPIPWEIENDANCYELIAHAVDLFLAQRNIKQSLDPERFDFVFQGESFYATATSLAGNKSLVVVFNERGCERMQAVV